MQQCKKFKVDLGPNLAAGQTRSTSFILKKKSEKRFYVIKSGNQVQTEVKWLQLCHLKTAAGAKNNVIKLS